MRPRAQRLSLRARALQALAQRDQSRVELRRKLLRHAAKAAEAEAEADAEPSEAAAAVDRLLDALEADGLLSSERFAESRVHARQARFGNLRIRSELAQHGVSIDAAVAAELAVTEIDRARDVRQRRFGDDPPADAAARAAQNRFLAQRGFSPDVIHRLMRTIVS